MIPKVRSCSPGGQSRRPPRPHPRRPPGPRPVAGDLHPRRGRAPWSSGPERGTLDDRHRQPPDGDLRPAAGHLRPRGQGSRLWDDARAPVPGLPLRAGRHVPRPRPPGRRRRHLRAGPHPAARLQPVRHRAPAPGGGHPRPAAGGGPGPGLLLQQRRRGQRVRHQAGPQVGGAAGRYGVVSAYGSFHGRTLATLHATGQPAKHEPFQPLPEGFRHVAWRDVDALAAAIDPSVAAVLLEPVQGEGGVNPGGAEYFQAVRRLCDERGVLLIVDEVQTGLGRTGRLVRVPALRHPAGRGDGRQGPRQRRADRRLLGPRRRRRRLRARATTPPRSVASRWRRRPPGPCWRSWRPKTSRPGPGRRGAAPDGGPREAAGRPGRAGPGAADRRRAGGGERGRPGGGRRPRGRPGRQRRHAHGLAAGPVTAGQRRRDRSRPSRILERVLAP